MRLPWCWLLLVIGCSSGSVAKTGSVEKMAQQLADTSLAFGYNLGRLDALSQLGIIYDPELPPKIQYERERIRAMAIAVGERK